MPEASDAVNDEEVEIDVPRPKNAMRSSKKRKVIADDEEEVELSLDDIRGNLKAQGLDVRPVAWQSEITDVGNSSVALVLTDPPYGASYISLLHLYSVVSPYIVCISIYRRS